MEVPLAVDKRVVSIFKGQCKNWVGAEVISMQALLSGLEKEDLKGLTIYDC